MASEHAGGGISVITLIIMRSLASAMGMCSTVLAMEPIVDRARNGAVQTTCFSRAQVAGGYRRMGPWVGNGLEAGGQASEGLFPAPEERTEDDIPPHIIDSIFPHEINHSSFSLPTLSIRASTGILLI